MRESYCTRTYLSDFQTLFGLRFMGMNVHQLVNLPDKALNIGPFWIPSCFTLEDLNGSIASLVHGTRHAAMQICSSVSAFLTLPVKLTSLNVNDPVRIFFVKRCLLVVLDM